MNVRMKKGLMLGAIATGLIMATAVVSRSLVSELGPPKISPVVVAQNQNATQDEQQIIQAAKGDLTKRFAKEYPPGVNISDLPSVEIAGITQNRPYAMVEWFWGGMGGQALMLKKQAVWWVILSDYGALTSNALTKRGFPADTAQALVQLHQKQSPADSAVLSNNIPPGLKACIPNWQVAKAELAGTVTRKGTTYYLLAAHPKEDEFATDLLISTNPQNRCLLLYYKPWGEITSLSRFAPAEVVRSLALQRLKREVEAFGGMAAYQQFLNTGADIPPRRTPEEVWALKQLGIQIKALPQSGQ